MIKKHKTIFDHNIAFVVDKYGEIHEQKGTDGRIILEEYEYVDEDIVFKKESNFVKLYDDMVPKLLDKLSPTEIAFVLGLIPYVSYGDCVLRKTRHGNSDVVTTKELSELMKIEYPTVRRLIASLEKKGVMGHHETGTILKGYEGKKKRVYTVNPYIYFRGVLVNKTVYDYYNKSGWED